MTSTNAELLPTGQDRARFLAHGYAVVPDVFAPEETANVIEAATRVSEAEMRANPDDPFTVDRDETGRTAPRKIDYPFLKSEVFRAFILDERLQRIASVFLGESAYLMRDQLFCKPPEVGSAKPFHQENANLGYAPADGMLITWIALDEARLDNGALRVLPGSHDRLWEHSPMPSATYNHVPPEEALEQGQEISLPVASGSVIIMHSQILHASAPNTSRMWRRAYAAHWVRSNITCATDAHRYGYSLTAGGGEYCAYRAP